MRKYQENVGLYITGKFETMQKRAMVSYFHIVAKKTTYTSQGTKVTLRSFNLASNGIKKSYCK